MFVIKDLQALTDALGEAGRNTRKDYHLTLAKLMEFLEQHQTALCAFTSPHSYRGYYSDLAFEPAESRTTGADLLKTLREEVFNKELEGYKGGLFLMDANTPLWIAVYGCCGEAFMDVSLVNGVIMPTTKIITGY